MSSASLVAELGIISDLSLFAGKDHPGVQAALERLEMWFQERDGTPAELSFSADGIRVDGEVVVVPTKLAPHAELLRRQLESAGWSGLWISPTGARRWLDVLDALGARPPKTDDLQTLGVVPIPAPNVPTPQPSKSWADEVEPHDPGATPEHGSAVPDLALRSISNHRDAVRVLARAAEAFELAWWAAEGSTFDEATWIGLEAAARDIEDAIDSRLDLVFGALRAVSQAETELSPSALHAARTAALAAAMVRGLELRGEARFTVTAAALFSHLPFALAGGVPSPTPVSRSDAASLVGEARAKTEAEPTLSGPTRIAGWLTAAEYRCTDDDRAERHLISRLVGVAAAYDALVSRTPGRKPVGDAEALKTLAQAPETFDSSFLTVLTALVAEFR
ncbi:MAG: hypothetical protein AAFU79_04375 [Myxococcota bacterium]